MTGFSLDWLDLREPADRAARDPDLAEAAADLVDAATDPLIVDLGCGSGSTLRALGPLITRPSRWRLVDGDPALLAEAARRAEAAGQVTVETVVLDLSGPVLLPFQGATMVTASALLDLVSDAFLQRLVATLASRGATFYAALSYDGRTVWSPAHPMDEAVLSAFNRHQATDKGFGPALGPRATATAADLLERAGYRVRIGDSDWDLGPEDADLVQALARGIAEAVGGPAGLDAEAVADWLGFRLEKAETGSVVVGHHDLLAEPA